jgi:hypothetical protein
LTPWGHRHPTARIFQVGDSEIFRCEKELLSSRSSVQENGH